LRNGWGEASVFGFEILPRMLRNVNVQDAPPIVVSRLALHLANALSQDRLDNREWQILFCFRLGLDHEFFIHQRTPEPAGWDWMSLQLGDHSELILFHIRRKDGSIDPFSAGTYVDARRQTVRLGESDFVLQSAGDTWKSPTSGASYPVHWKISVAKLDIELEARTPLPSQELAGDSHIAPTYWEGAIDLTGKRSGAAIAGSGYLEMTGYAKRAAGSNLSDSSR